MTEVEWLERIQSDSDMMLILKIIEGLELKDSWLAAGAVRNYIWNVVSGRSGFDDTTDIDVVFFDPDMSDEETQALERKLLSQYPQYQWQVKNQYHMHRYSPDTEPYHSTRDAIAKYPETCTAVALRQYQGKVDLFAPYGLEVISRLVVKPTPHFQASPSRMKLYRERLAKKDWLAKWPQLQVLED